MRIKNSKLRSKLNSKSRKTQSRSGPPLKNEGVDGAITIREVGGTIKLYAKYKGKWYETTFS